MIRLSILLISCGLVAAVSTAQDSRPPNIVYIVSDDQGYRDLGCFGGDEIQTPQLDRLAKDGVKLTSFYVTWPACTPSRGSLLTGRYPQRNGLYDMIRNDMINYGHKFTEVEYALSPEMTLGLDRREVTIADVLKKAGYATGMVGKWDSGRAKRFLPTSRDFDSFYGFANTGIDYWTHERYGIPSMFRGTERIKEEGYATDLFRREALAFVKQHAGQPFFLYFAPNAPHSASNLERDSCQVPDDVLKDRYPIHDPKQNRTKYMGMVTRMDDAIGELLDTLRELKLEENTLVIFHSDNGGGGPADNGPLRGKKASMWEGGLRVPAIVRWPGRLPAGNVCDEFLTTLEVFPTLVAAAGAQPPENVTLDGIDMTAVLRGEKHSPRDEMFWERRLDKAARVGNYKWVAAERGGGLFDLSSDLGEERDLSAEQPELLAQIKARFAAWKKEMDAAEPRGPFRDY
ncbi:MAG TPA: sulfatase-like hydrolase/transferase [Pirellulaceae bacterium]|nr:sulfatase-like hydrolase/transferase [Pirellulaceae bacterium]